MVKRIAIFLSVLAWLLPVQAAQTILKRDMFVPVSLTNVAPYSSTNLGTFAFATDWPIISQGATTNGMPLGWSGWVQRRAPQNVSWTNFGSNIFVQAGMWVKFHQFAVSSADVPSGSGTANSSRIMSMETKAHGSRRVLNVDGVGALWVRSMPSDTNVAQLTANTWYYMASSWNSHSASSLLDGVVSLGTLGSALTNIYTYTNLNISDVITGIVYGNNGTTFWSGKITGTTLDELADYTDIGIPADMIAPPSTRSTYYVASNGSDLNSGAYSTNAFGTGFMLANLFRYGGASGNMTPWVLASNTNAASPTTISHDVWNNNVMSGVIIANGDRILIDTSSGVLRTTNAVNITTNNIGVELGSATATQARISPWFVLSGFTQYDSVNWPLIWQAADAQCGSVMWEDKKWMNNPTNSAGTIVAARTNLSAVPGSFFSDCTNIYFTTFDASDPNSNGKLYEASQWIWNKDTLSQYQLFNDDGSANYIHDIQAYGNLWRDQTNGVWSDAYVFRQGCDGPFAMVNCDLRYGGKHVYGAVSGATNLYRLVANTACNQGSPWTDITGASGFNNIVEFPSTNTPSGRNAYYINVDASKNSLIGSADGQIGGDFLFHTSGTNLANSYSNIWLFGCSGGQAWGVSMVQNGGTIISNCTCSYMTLGLQTNQSVWNTRVNGHLSGTVGTTFMRNFILNRIDDLSENFTLIGPWNFQNCTIDGRNGIMNGPNNTVLQSGGSSSVFGFTNCVFIPTVTASNYVTGFKMLTNDVVHFDNNVWMSNSEGTVISTNNTRLTFAQWQATGMDTHGTNADPALSANYRPYAKTPTWNIGLENGPAIDYSGKLFQSRRTAGAYEYVVPNAQFLFGHK